MNFVLSLLIGIAMAGPLKAKRVAPPEIQPVHFGSQIIKDSWEREGAGFAMYLIANSALDSKELWKTKLYSRAYKSDLEKDVQEVYLSSLHLKKKVLIAIDESGRKYKVNPATGELLEPKSAQIYEPMK